MILKRKKQPDLIKKFFSKIVELAKDGVWLGAFLIEVDFRRIRICLKMCNKLRPKRNNNKNYLKTIKTHKK